MSEQIPSSSPQEHREVMDKMPDAWAELRAKILETIPNRTEGLDTERVNSFMSSLGLSANEYRVLYDEDIPRLRELLQPSGMDGLASFTGLKSGVFLQHINLAFIKRQSEVEQVNGLVYTEGMIIHELAHQSGYMPLHVKTERGFNTPRVGFGTLRTGAFLEEGFADLLRGKYLTQATMPDNVKQQILAKFRLAEDTPLDKEVRLTKEIKGEYFRFFYRVPIRHLFLSSSGETQTVASGIAAGGLELLCQKDPGLFDALLAARGGDIERLREIPKRINAISPGLYPVLQNLQYSEDDFIRGNVEIARRLSID